MADDVPILHGDKRQGECPGFAQRVDDELFGVIADLQRGEGLLRQRVDGADVSGGFGADDNFDKKILLLLPIKFFSYFQYINN